MYYGEKFKNIEELDLSIKEYIEWYSNKRIKNKLKGFTLVACRQKSIQSGSGAIK